MTLIVTGTAATLMIAAVLIQVFRARDTMAGPQQKSPLSASTSEYFARVDDVLITREMVGSECIDRYGKDVLDNIINRTIIHQACKKRGITISADDVNREIQSIATKFNLDVSSWYELLQMERGLSPVQYQRDVIWPMIALKKLAGANVSVTDTEIQREYINRFGQKVRARMIMCDNLRRAQEVWDKAKRQPNEFDRLARDESIEQNSASLGGVIPPIPQYSGNTKISEEAFKLKPGDLSSIIEIGPPSRYIFLLCEGRTERIPHDINEVKDEIRADLLEEKTQRAVGLTFSSLKKTSRIDNYITNTSTGGVRRARGTALENELNGVQQTGGTAPTFGPATPQGSRVETPR
ncbi:MAG: SurA N-terminal domain-containing protein [Planctomycetota bacterium]|nr:SurA N-terminal domain-containing protein [Planctomycetota bacterium]